MQSEPASSASSPVSVFSWRGCLSPLVVVPALSPAIVLYVAPTNVLDRAPSLHTFTDWLAGLIPYMSGHADGTQIPQVALLVNCLTVAAVAVIALVFLVQSALDYRQLYQRHVERGPHPLRTYVVGLVGLPLGFAIVAASVMIPGDVSWAPGATQTRTITYAFLSGTVSFCAGVLIGVSPLTLRLFLDAWLFSRPITFRV